MCLQYADDTILFLDEDTEKVENLKLVLSCFEQVWYGSQLQQKWANPN